VQGLQQAVDFGLGFEPVRNLGIGREAAPLGAVIRGDGDQFLARIAGQLRPKRGSLRRRSG
jgi:hypothetical protein